MPLAIGVATGHTADEDLPIIPYLVLFSSHCHFSLYLSKIQPEFATPTDASPDVPDESRILDKRFFPF
jgi:hypothetical protein